MGGIDTVRGIGYQQAHAVLEALQILDSTESEALRVEGVDDVLDIEIHGPNGRIIAGKQIKTRTSGRSWSQKELVDILSRWAALGLPKESSFEFVTDGELGPGAERLNSALGAAREGNPGPLALFLDVESDDPICDALSNCSIRQEPSGVEAVLQKAEQVVRSMLPADRSTTDLRIDARRIVNDLFVFLTERGSRKDASDRLVVRDQIADLLGGLTYIRQADRWPGTLRKEYVDAVVTKIAPPSVTPFVRSALESDLVDVLHLIASRGTCNLIAGATGTGKTTAVQALLLGAASQDAIVVRVAAEGYIANRLDTLVAASIGQLVGREISSATARQVIADTAVTVVIDGVSEIPRPSQRSLRDELASMPMTAADIVLVGRDAVALSGVSARNCSVFYAVGFDRQRRRDAAKGMLATGQHGEFSDTATLVAQVEKALGDAAGNPMLFGMGMELVSRGIPFESRAALYRASVISMCERARAPMTQPVEAVLAMAYSQLLDEGRRFCGPLEWGQLLADGVAEVNRRGTRLELEDVLDTVARTGLTTTLTGTEVIVPLHDSYADYFSGLAWSEHFAPLPLALNREDVQRVLFAAESGRMNADFREVVVRDLPFVSVRMANFDPGPADPDEVRRLYHALAPFDSRKVSHWNANGRVVIHLIEGPGRELSANEGKALLATTTAVVVEASQGSLAAAVTLWRTSLNEVLMTRSEAVGFKAMPVEETRAALERHFSRVAEIEMEIVKQLFSQAESSAILGLVEPRGTFAVIESQRTDIPGQPWSLRYERSAETRVEIGAGLASNNGFSWGTTTTDHILRASSRSEAVNRIRNAVGLAAESPHWL